MEIGYIILGWLLGILSPGIINRISDNYKKNTLRRIIISELKDLQKRLVLLPFKVKSNYGIVDEKLFVWIKTQEEKLGQFKQNDFIEAYEKMVLENRGDLTNFLEHCNIIEKRENPSFHFKKMSTSTIDSNLMNFGMLDNDFLEKLLEVKFQINVFNEEVSSVSDYVKMTFYSNITDINHEIITKEIKRKNLLIAKKAIYIVEKINSIVYPEKQN
jgi:hypothetical protein